MGLLLHLDADVAGHLAVAVRRHREVLYQLGRASPDELEQLEQTLTEIATGSQERSGTVTAPGRANVIGMERSWLSPVEVSATTGLSVSTVRRRIAAGSLPSSKIGRSRRVSRETLNEFMQSGRAA